MLDYFIKGFHLTNSAYKFIFFSSIFYIGGTLLLKVTEPTWEIFAFLFGFIFFILGISLYLISPLILEQQQKTNLSLNQIYKIYQSNLRRSWKGGLLFLLLTVFIFMISVIILAFVPNVNTEKIFDVNSFSGFMFNILITTICGFTLFAPIFYSLKKQSLISSIRSSILFAFAHFSFFLVILLISGIYLIPSFILSSDIISELLKTFFISYIGTLTISTALIYYQKNS